MARINRFHPNVIIAGMAIITGIMIAAIVSPASADAGRRYVATPDGPRGHVQVALASEMKDKLELATEDGVRGQAMLAGADGLGRLPVRADAPSRIFAIADGVFRIIAVLAGAD